MTSGRIANLRVKYAVCLRGVPTVTATEDDRGSSGGDAEYNRVDPGASHTPNTPGSSSVTWADDNYHLIINTEGTESGGRLPLQGNLPPQVPCMWRDRESLNPIKRNLT